jgi:hypothetical protein
MAVAQAEFGKYRVVLDGVQLENGERVEIRSRTTARSSPSCTTPAQPEVSPVG